MNLFLLMPLFLGLTVIAQGALNQRISAVWGLSWAVFLNAALFLVVSILLIFVTKYLPQLLPQYLKMDEFNLEKFKIWFLIPGLCGFFIVLGIPWSMQINGPSITYILLIVSQIILSLLLDKFVFDLSLNTIKLVGATLVIVGAVLVAVSPK